MTQAKIRARKKLLLHTIAKHEREVKFHEGRIAANTRKLALLKGKCKHPRAKGDKYGGSKWHCPDCDAMGG